LPVAAPSVVAGHAAATGAPTPGPKRRVLVVDDNVDAAESLATLLRAHGHNVQTACDGREGLAKAEKFDPHVVFLDLTMPHMGGVEAAARIRQLPHGDETVLVALTGWGQGSDVEHAQTPGFDHHLLKPIDPDALGKLFSLQSNSAR